MVCAPPAVGGMGSAGLFAFALLLHKLQLIFIDFLLCITGMQNSLGIVAAKHCLGIDHYDSFCGSNMFVITFLKCRQPPVQQMLACPPSGISVVFSEPFTSSAEQSRKNKLIVLCPIV